MSVEARSADLSLSAFTRFVLQPKWTCLCYGAINYEFAAGSAIQASRHKKKHIPRFRPLYVVLVP